MKTRATHFTIMFLLANTLVAVAVYIPRTLVQKVMQADLIVYGVATLEGPPLKETQHPEKRECSLAVLATLWPTNQPAMKTILVDRWVWAQWPDTWWKYYSCTGVFFLVRTSTAVKNLREDMNRKPRMGLDSESQLDIDDHFLGTNQWIGLEGFDDWYEPQTNVAAIQEQIEKSKK